jgi:YHS domain-containing protein
MLLVADSFAKKKNMTRLIILTAIIIATLHANAQKSEIFSNSGHAIQGYDPVAYFTEGKPVKGSENFSYQWKDATWHFASQQNLEAFKKTPEKFAPQYGGYCAYGLSEGHKAPTEPDAWTITNGKLYLNYNTSVRSEWQKGKEVRIQKADQNWPQIKNKG